MRVQPGSPVRVGVMNIGPAAEDQTANLSNAKMSAAIAKRDATDIAALYAEDASLLASGAPRIDGRAEIEGFWKQAVDSGSTNMVLQTTDVRESGDLAIEIGHWTSTAFGGDPGNYVMVWRRESGDLKVSIDIFNSESQPA